MTRLKMSIAAGIVLALTLTAVAVLAQQRGQAKGWGAGMGSVMYLDRAWCALAFELNASNDQIAKLRPTFQACWKTRKAAMDKARASKSFSGLEATGKSIKASIDAQLKKVLTKDQMAKWVKLQQTTYAPRPGGAQGGGRR